MTPRCLPLLALLALATTALAEEPIDYRGYIDNARFQIRKEYWDQAIDDLEAAAEHPDGRLDPEVWFLLAQVRARLGRVPEAREAAQQAVTHARDADQAAQADALLMALEQQYGLVRIEGTQPGVRFRPRIRVEGVLFDPSQQAPVDQLVRDLRRSRPLLPLTLGLPAGDWEVNGVVVEVQPGQVAPLRLGPARAGGNLAVARLAWLEVAGGVAVPLGHAEHLMPAPDLQLGLTVPIGGIWTLGPVAHWTPTVVLTDQGVYEIDAASSTAGIRVGPLFDDGARFLVRPAVGYRAGTVAGVRLPCGKEGDSWTCGNERTPDVVLYARGPAHVVFVEVAADYLDRQRTSGVGIGVKMQLDHAIVTLPATGESSRGLVGAWEVEPEARRHGRTSLHVLGTISFAF